VVEANGNGMTVRKVEQGRNQIEIRSGREERLVGRFLECRPGVLPSGSPRSHPQSDSSDPGLWPVQVANDLPPLARDEERLLRQILGIRADHRAELASDAAEGDRIERRVPLVVHRG
jgi:hypothetical protein